MSLQIERVPADATESQALMLELWTELDALYGNGTGTPSRLERMEAPGAAFVIARANGKAVGCAAIRPLTSDVAEMKRVFVQHRARGRGVGRTLIEKLEQIARGEGFSEIWIETGLRQPDAIRLYESLGYTRRAAFGDYKDEPLSVCYEKRLK